MSEIKAIETQYAGCRFRSRLEARPRLRPHPLVDAALTAARSARFEFGESGR